MKNMKGKRIVPHEKEDGGDSENIQVQGVKEVCKKDKRTEAIHVS